MDQQLFCYR